MGKIFVKLLLLVVFGNLGICALDCNFKTVKLNGEYLKSCVISNETIGSDNKLSNLSVLHLNISFLDITELPNHEFTNLKALTVHQTLISKLNGDLFEQTKFVEYCDFSSNKITEIDEKIFRPIAGKLIYLNLSFNLISNIPKSLFKNLNVLKVLILKFNNLLELRPLNLLESLEYLSVANNKISNLDEGTFSKHKNLKFLDLSYNFIKKIPQNLLPPANELNLSDNRISIIERRVKSSLQQIPNLDLSNNKCVDQIFKFRFLPVNSSRLLDKVLFPFCDENFAQLKAKRKSSSVNSLQITIIICVAVIVTIFLCSVFAICLHKLRERRSVAWQENSCHSNGCVSGSALIELKGDFINQFFSHFIDGAEEQ